MDALIKRSVTLLNSSKHIKIPYLAKQTAEQISEILKVNDNDNSDPDDSDSSDLVSDTDNENKEDDHPPPKKKIYFKKHIGGGKKSKPLPKTK